MPTDPRLKLEKAFKKLPVRIAQQWRVPSMVNALAGLAGKTNIKVPPKFIDTSRARAQKELNTFVRAVESLANYVETLHQPVILALASQSLLAPQLVQALRKTSALARTAKLARLRRHAGEGRPRKLAANVIARVLARNYKTLTGKAAKVSTDWDNGKAYGPYLRLVSSVFKALGVDASPEAAARKVVRRKRRKITPKK